MLTEKERELARLLGRFKLTDPELEGAFCLLQEDDQMIQQMIDWIAENPEATSQQFLKQVTKVARENAGID